MSSTSSVLSHPDVPDGSRGSSVSSGFVNEYEEILKYAIVAPKLQIGNNNPLFGSGKPAQSANMINNSLTPSVSSSSSSSSSSPNDRGIKEKEEAEVEVRVLQAKNAVENYKSTPETFGNEKQLRFLQATNAIDTLLETPKDAGEKSAYDKAAYTNNESPESLVGEIQSPSIDKDLLRMDSAMDDWCLQLKRNVLNELADMKKRQLQYEENVMEQLKSKHNAETLRLAHEVESLKELLYTFEQNVKQKDEVIVNLTNVLNKQKERSEKIRLFSAWRLKHNDEQRQGFATKMADKFYKKTLMTKAWIAWRSVVESTWKKRVEKACQIKSQEVCLQLTQDYEERLQALQKELAATRTEVAKMHTEREFYEENMKKAFMRGVCALNMEAMSMFKEEQTVESNINQPPGVHYPCVQQKDDDLNSKEFVSHRHSSPPSYHGVETSQTAPSRPSSSNSNIGSKKSVRFNEPSTADLTDHPVAVTKRQNVPVSKKNNPQMMSSSSNRKQIHVKMTGKKDHGMLRNGSGSQASAISSIKVERHTKQTPSSQHLIQPRTIPSLACTRAEFNNISTSSGLSGVPKKPINTSVVVD